MGVQAVHNLVGVTAPVKRNGRAPKRDKSPHHALQAIIRSLEGCQNEIEDPDEQTFQVRPDTVALALELVDLVSQKIAQCGVTWLQPNVCLDDDGRMSLTWRMTGAGMFVIVDGEAPDGIVFVFDELINNPMRRVTGVDGAADYILNGLRFSDSVRAV